MRTINGKEIGEVFRELERDFPKEDVRFHDVTDKPYVPVEKIRARLDEVVGRWNWSFTVSAPQLWVNGPVESCILSGSLTIYDDEGRPIEKGAAGGATVVYSKEAERPTSVPNSVDSASKDVLKRSAKMFNIADNLERYAKNGKPKPEALKGVEAMKVSFLSEFQALPKGGARATVTYNGEKRELVIFDKEWRDLVAKHPDKFKVGGRLNYMNLEGQLTSYGSRPQIRYVSLGRGA